MRGSGILLPIFSLPGKYGIGCFSREAYRFIDFLKNSNQKYWQVLPIGPTSYGDSPYQSFSIFAGNPYFISLEKLIDKGLLDENECDNADFGENNERIDYEKLYNNRFDILKKAFKRSNINCEDAFLKFRNDNQYWLNDYALFMSLKDKFDGRSFTEWPDDIRLRKSVALEAYREELNEEINFYEFVQYEFYCQWFNLKKYANDNGIKIIGDIPIYVAYDSSDVWAYPELFQLDDDKKMISIAGCPPDGFSETGQLWGNPLYKWEYHKEKNYEWWINRIKRSAKLYDIIRIDHFRGFDEYYSVPGCDKVATYGHWEKGPGIELFNAIKNAIGDVEIIAEDLGYMTDSVRKLVKDSGFPNMKVLEFAFDKRDSSGPSEYLPYNYDKNCVVYTGTHDNETLKGWLESIQCNEVEMIEKYVGKKIDKSDDLIDEIIRLAHASVADMCIIPLQDYMHLGREARMNTPSTLGNNWLWRIKSMERVEILVDKIKEITEIYGRN